MKYIFETEDHFEAQALLKAVNMHLRINSVYDSIFRDYIKYGTSGVKELTQEEVNLVEEIKDKFVKYFEEFLE